MRVLPVYMSVYQMGTRCLWMSGNGFESPRAEVFDGCICHVVVEIKPRSSGRATSTPNHCAISPALTAFILCGGSKQDEQVKKQD